MHKHTYTYIRKCCHTYVNMRYYSNVCGLKKSTFRKTGRSKMFKFACECTRVCARVCARVCDMHVKNGKLKFVISIFGQVILHSQIHHIYKCAFASMYLGIYSNDMTKSNNQACCHAIVP